MAEGPTRPRTRTPKPPAPPKPWQRAEAGRYRSSDGRFTLESDGGGRWFVTDDEALDELGLARTTGPFATLDAAKSEADAARDRPAEPSPLAARLAESAARPRPDRRPKGAAEPEPATDRGPEAGRDRAALAPARAAARAATPQSASGSKSASQSTSGSGSKSGSASASASPAVPEEPAPRRTWLDDLEDADRDGAVRARRLIAALAHEGVADAEAVVRRDLLGGTPAVATRLLARAILASLAGLRDPSAADVAAAVAGALASSRKRGGLPGWELVERDGPNGERRGLRLTAADLRAAAEHDAGQETGRGGER